MRLITTGITKINIVFIVFNGLKSKVANYEHVLLSLTGLVTAKCCGEIIEISSPCFKISLKAIAI